MIVYILIGYFIIAAIVCGCFGHYFDGVDDDIMLISFLWPILIISLPFIGIVLLVKKILDNIL